MVAIGTLTSCHEVRWPHGHPSRFSASIGGGLDGSDKLEMSPDGAIHCSLGQRRELASDPSAPKTVDVIPSDAEWARFYQRMAHAKVLSWRARYTPPEPVHDGTQWAISLAIPGDSVETSGNNAFPSDEQYKEAFLAIRELVHLEHSFW